MDYLDPVKSVYSVPYRSAKRFSILLLCTSVAYAAGAGSFGLDYELAAIPFDTAVCIFSGPLAVISIPYAAFAFFYVVFTERPLRSVVGASTILVYCNCAKPNWRRGLGAALMDWWPSGLWTIVLVVALLFLLYRALHKVYGKPRDPES